MRPVMSQPGSGPTGCGRGQAVNGPTGLENSLRSMQLKPQFQWNLDAPTFVPRVASNSQINPECSTQNYNHNPQFYDNSNSYGVEEPWIEPSNNFNMVPTYPDTLQAAIRGKHAQLLQEIQVGLEQLISKPDELDVWSEAIQDRLMRTAVDPEAMTYVTQMIVQMALCCSNSGYLIGRLCGHLSQEMKDFRAQLLSVCHSEHERYKAGMGDMNRFSNFVLIMGELYVNIKNAEHNRIVVLGSAICEELEFLISQPSEDNLKCATRVLKCTGSALDADGLTGRLDGLLTALTTITNTQPVSESLRRQVTALLEYRTNKWDAGTPIPAPLSLPGAGAPLYMGPDGVPLTDEERAFLEENLGRLESSSDTRDSEDEMQAAYLSFLEQQR